MSTQTADAAAVELVARAFCLALWKGDEDGWLLVAPETRDQLRRDAATWLSRRQAGSIFTDLRSALHDEVTLEYNARLDELGEGQSEDYLLALADVKPAVRR